MSEPIKPALRRLFDAQSHWHNANESYFDPNKFRIAINSCIQELRNVTFVLQKNKHQIKGFKEWYEPWQEVMKANTSLRWLVGARNHIVKKGDLSLNSILRIEVIGSYREDEVPIFEESYEPNSSNSDIYNKIIDCDLPREVFKKSYVKVERRWVDKNYPEFELLELLTTCWSAVADLLMDAPGTEINKQEKPLRSAKHPPCMYKGSETRSCWMKIDGENLVTSVIKQEEIDLKIRDIEVLRDRYGNLPMFQPQAKRHTFKSLCNMFFKTAMGVLKSDKYHIHLAIIFVNNEPVKITEFRNEDQADKYRTMRLIASEIEQIGADSFIMISEAWTAPYDPKFPHRSASESPEKSEILSLVGISDDGEGYVLSVPFTRKDEEIIYGHPYSSGIEGMNIIEPIISVWKKHKKEKS